MATYNSSNIQNKTGVSQSGGAGNVNVAYAEVVCSSAPTTADTLNFFYLPANARIVAAALEATDMDTNVSPTIALNIGDSGSASRLFAASTVAQAGTASTALAVAGNAYKTTAKTLITGVPSANAATGAAGSVYLTVFYVVE